MYLRRTRDSITVIVVLLSLVLFVYVLLRNLKTKEGDDEIAAANIDLFIEAKKLNAPVKKKFHANDPKRRWKAEDEKRAVMVMDTVKTRLSEIRQVSRYIITHQKRAPDSRYNINVTNSDLQSLDRNITDTRPPICKTLRYERSSLPKASVIIPFYNEALSMLLRTVHSVLNRSPDSLLKEVILVDDCSPDKHLHQPLQRYLDLLPKVKIIRNSKRQGLIVSRMKGAKIAEGSVLIFLDAHSEANEGWLEPLLEELKKNRRQVLQPFVDGIDALTLSIEAPGVYHKGAFSWDLRYTWIKVNPHEQMAAHDTGLPFPTPTLVGCAIAVDKEYFEEIGNFDEGLKVWGGENIELGFRTWMCGGQMTTVTCSHVGHVFKEFPYTFDGNKEEIVQKNLIRVADTWMDGMKKYFYASTRIYEFKRAELNEEEVESLNKRKELRIKLKCHNFEWFLYNIIPQLNEPPMDSLFHGEIANLQSSWCWEVTDDYFISLSYVCYHHKIIPQNYFTLSKDGLLRYRDKCVSIQPPSPMLILSECPFGLEEIEKFGVWRMDVGNNVVEGELSVSRMNANNTLEVWCIEQVTNALPRYKGRQMPQLSDCGPANNFKVWRFTYAFDFSRVPEEIL